MRGRTGGRTLAVLRAGTSEDLRGSERGHAGGSPRQGFGLPGHLSSYRTRATVPLGPPTIRVAGAVSQPDERPLPMAPAPALLRLVGRARVHDVMRTFGAR
ncbi:hypothetical protein GCM10009539_64950 [Cryptosporangium japonicum]|uniref:Uncharacterized protein n=1 Tax=Cryptosporangium japonicum TaxID=80872 RepID=A0ABN0V085_9ACTN